MSEHDEVPELSDASRAFLAEHAQTGEPSAEALAKLKPLVLSAQAKGLSSTGSDRPARQGRFRSEWMAAAAVLAVIVGAQGLYMAYRSQQETTQDAQVQAVQEAWRAGDTERAQRLASAECSGPACGSLKASLDRALELSRRLDQLSAPEQDELRTLDASLSGGAGSALTLKLPRRGETKPLMTEEEALARGRALWEQARLDEALQLAVACLVVNPDSGPCLHLVGDIELARAKGHPGHPAWEVAREYYERALEHLAPGGQAAETVRRQLDAIPSGPRATDAEILAEQARIIRPGPEAQQAANAGGLGATIAKLEKGQARLEAMLDGTEAQELFDAAQARRKEQDYPAALKLLDDCVARFPDFPGCHRLRGSVYASIAMTTNDQQALAQARKAYLEFLRVAPKDDPYVPKVQAILETRPAEPAAYDPELARRYANQALAYLQEDEFWGALGAVQNARSADPSEPTTLSAERALREAVRDRFLLGEQVRHEDPRRAAKLFLQVTDGTEAGDPMREKALLRLERLAPKEVNGRLTLRVNEEGRIHYADGIDHYVELSAEVATVLRVDAKGILVRAREPGTLTLFVLPMQGALQRWVVEVLP